MPYEASGNLPFEQGSKLGHLSVLDDPLVQELVREFKRVHGSSERPPLEGDRAVVPAVDSLDIVIAVDGSVTDVPNTFALHKTLSFIKIGAIALDMEELAKLEVPIVDPRLVVRILEDGADTFSTALPLSNVTLPGESVFSTIRRVLQATLTRAYEGSLCETLRFLTSYDWAPETRPSLHFACPLCHNDIPLPADALEFACPRCSGNLHLIDYLGLTNGLAEEGNDSGVAIDLMLVLEHLLVVHYLRTAISRGIADRVLVLKDGPLMLSGQYARLVEPIRAWLAHLKASSQQFYLAGVEKSGAFCKHIPEITALMADGELFVPSNRYILSYIKGGGSENTQYGERVLYGAKAYYRADERNVVVLNLPYGAYKTDVQCDELIGVSRIVSTLARLRSRQFQNALLPIVAANKIVSLSVYPSNKILERFTMSALDGGSHK